MDASEAVQAHCLRGKEDEHGVVKTKEIICGVAEKMKESKEPSFEVVHPEKAINKETDHDHRTHSDNA